MAEKYPERLGHLLTPANKNRAAMLRGLLPFGVDNGAYSGFDPGAFRKLLALVRQHPARCLWAVCPDVVADARATLANFWQWREEIAEAQVPVAFVGQDGAEALEIPWRAFDCWFIGGSTRFKLSRASLDLASEARRQRKWVHMGRVNSMKRLALAFRWGCDSVDGSSYSRFHHRSLTGRPDMSIERHLRFMMALERTEKQQQRLFQE